MLAYCDVKGLEGARRAYDDDEHDVAVHVDLSSEHKGQQHGSDAG